MKISCEDYTIYVNSIESLSSFCKEKEYTRFVVLVDENTELHCLPLLEEMLLDISLEVILISSGEHHKNIDTCKIIWQELLIHQTDRQSLCINLGGGVIGDMGGFCASTFMRGMDFIQIPTTLLSMVDASVGGKLGIDFEDRKNYIGLFNNPQGVFVFTEFLKTLDSEQIRSGFAEVIKHGLIQDKKYWEDISKLDILNQDDWESLIVKSVLIKKEIVDQDPREKGLRKLLNFGHTIGHAIESHFLHSAKPLLHGEAVAIGIICESHISYQKGMLTETEYEAIKKYILNRYGDVLPITINDETVLSLCKGDKKNVNQEFRFTLLKTVGEGVFDYKVTSSEIINSLKEVS